jgi:hypothetical protein
VAVLPADGATLATSLSGGPMLVAHTGRAHLGLRIDRALLRDVARARRSLPPPREPTGSAAARVDQPEVIPFRHATSRTLTVAGDDLHLTLHATGDPTKPDVHVQLRMERTLVERLAQHDVPHLRTDRLLALAALLVIVGVFVAALA